MQSQQELHLLPFKIRASCSPLVISLGRTAVTVGVRQLCTVAQVGATLTTKDPDADPGSDALGLSGMESVRLNEADSGLRVVRVREGGVEHAWVAIVETPPAAAVGGVHEATALDPAATIL